MIEKTVKMLKTMIVGLFRKPNVYGRHRKFKGKLM